ncbi:MAG TPA: M28 family peptidase, partial [Pyrinomonadaceae bacterium]|nr:M28 family peptidase [Pyrinomonadaceae bacterium]
MLKRKIISVVLLSTFLFSSVAFGQATVYQAPKEVIDKIKDEGMNRSQVMQTLSYLSDVIGGRLTASPNMKRANEWTRDTMSKWGMQNAHLEAWGPFGRGWSLKAFTAQVNSPQLITVTAYPKAWAPSTKGAVTGEVVYLDAKTDEDLAKYKGQLRGKIVLVSPLRPLKAIDTPLSNRFSDDALAKMAGAPAPPVSQNPNGFSPEQIKNFLNFFNTQARRMKFLMDEGAAVMIDNSGQGSGGTLFVQGASVAVELSPDIKSIEDLFNQAGFQPQRKGADANMMPQVTMATEDYNRIIRMIQFGEKPTMTVNVQVQYHDEDSMGYNTVAEISGTDPKLKDEVVMVGGHLDSWHSSGGATDNGAGCAVAMEA